MGTPTGSDELGRLMQAAQAGDAAAYLDLLRTITPRIRQIITRQRGFAGIDSVIFGRGFGVVAACAFGAPPTRETFVPVPA